jgi:hypothetical protein
VEAAVEEEGVSHKMTAKKKSTRLLAETALRQHFGARQVHSLVTASRTFPVTARVDVQSALDKMFASRRDTTLLGLHAQFNHETVTISHLLGNPHYPVVIGPLQHEEIDIGETMPARCLRQGVWLSAETKTPFAVLVSPAVRFGRSEGTHIEIAVPPGDVGMGISRDVLNQIEKLVRATASYRGKVISLDATDRYSGHGGDLRVHKLRSVKREARN